MSNTPNQITFARLETRGRNTADRGFAFYNDREGRNVFVHITRCREVTGEGDDLSFGERIEAEHFPRQIVLRVGPGRKPGQHAAVEWGEDPEPYKLRHTKPWHEVHSFHGFVGGEVHLYDDRHRLIGDRFASSPTLRSFTVDGDTVTVMLSNGKAIQGKWWEFNRPRRQPPYGWATIEFLERGFPKYILTFYPSRGG